MKPSSFSLSAMVLLLAASHAHSAPPGSMGLHEDPAAFLEQIGAEDPSARMLEQMDRAIEQRDVQRPEMDNRGEVSEFMHRYGIADEQQAQKYAQTLRAMGIPEDEARLYIAVSQSMPIKQLRAYALEAAHAGGTLVFKGVEPDQDLEDFLWGFVWQLVDFEGGAPAQIDPRVFDAFEIDVVPTVVLTETESLALCNKRVPEQRVYEGQSFEYTRCKPQEDRFYKLSGAVTLAYALEEFEDAGSEQAGAFRQALGDAYLLDAEAEAEGQIRGLSESYWDDRPAILDPDAIQDAFDKMGVDREWPY